MSHFKDLKNFLDNSLTSIFAANHIETSLVGAGFKKLDIHKTGAVPKGEKIYIRDKGQIAAFCLPTKALHQARYLLAHTDSPCLKLKPHPLITKEGMDFLVCEPYGSPLLSSYLGQPLTLAGQIALDTKDGIKIQSISLDRTFLIPEPAIHLSKDANASVDKGKLLAFIGMHQDRFSIEKLLNVKDPIIAHDLYLVAANSLLEMGLEAKLFAGPRLDNLSSCYSMCEVLKEAICQQDTLLGAFFFDHEEIGSETASGAKSHFFKKRLKHMIDAYSPIGMIDIQTQAYSLDVAHANHVCYPDKFDEQHPCILNHGVVIKHHSQHKYAQDLTLFAYAKKHLAKSQVFTMRNEIGTGSTLGPYFSSLFSIPTQDIGLPLLGMHSCTEIIAENDLAIMIEFLKGFFYVG